MVSWLLPKGKTKIKSGMGKQAFCLIYSAKSVERKERAEHSCEASDKKEEIRVRR